MSAISVSAVHRRHRNSRWPMTAVLVITAAISRQSQAADTLNPYLGAAVGQSRVAADVPYSNPLAYDERLEFEASHAAFSVMLGTRPTTWLGGELAYIDLGDARENLFGYPADASIKGTAVFAMLFLPLPIVDLYLKAGAAHLQTRIDTIIPYLPLCAGCAPPRIERDRTNTSGAAGVGSQFKFGAWAARLEYERFNAAGGNSGLLSVGATWTF